jgi:hypothetical protein
LVVVVVVVVVVYVCVWGGGGETAVLGVTHIVGQTHRSPPATHRETGQGQGAMYWKGPPHLVSGALLAPAPCRPQEHPQDERSKEKEHPPAILLLPLGRRLPSQGATNLGDCLRDRLAIPAQQCGVQAPLVKQAAKVPETE